MAYKKRNYLYSIDKPLRAKIVKYFTEKEFDELRKQKIDVIVTRKNADMKRSKTEYISILQKFMTYERFVDCVVASASIPMFAQPTVINGFQYVDGGVLDPIPTALLSQYVGCEIDIWLCHSGQEEQAVSNPSDSWTTLLSNLLNDMRFEIRNDDLNTVKNDCTVYYARYYEWSASNFNIKNMRKSIQEGIRDHKTIKGVKL
jgi:predicted acylesterase/phospholipase RssA